MATFTDATRVRLAFAFAAAVFVALATSSAWTCDDAFIAFRYSRNLAEGLGLRFNIGVDPPVEGYTQLGWILWFALLERFASDPIPWSRMSEIASGAVLLFLVCRRAGRSGLGALGLFAAAMFFATEPSVVVWATGGLGTMPFALIVFVLAERMLGDVDRPRYAQATAAAVCLTLWRFDGMYWVGLVFLVALVRAVRPTIDARRLRRTLSSGTVVGLAVAAQSLWRYAYHGDWLPNTARAKVGFSVHSFERGLQYLATNLLAVPALAIVVVVAVALVIAQARRREAAWTRACVFMALGTLLYGVLVGGDFMAMGRFLLPAIAFLALVVGVLVDALARRRGVALGAALLALLLAGSIPARFDVHIAPRGVRESMYFRYGRVYETRDYETEYAYWQGMSDRAQQWSLVGRALALHTTPDQSLVRGSIGAVGYYSRLVIHDQFGLVNREVAQGVPVDPESLSMPGHDRVAPIEFFAPWNPTYRAARVAFGAERMAEEQRKLDALPAPERKNRLLRPLRADQGFPSDGLLVLELY